jgi:hypothetical protein
MWEDNTTNAAPQTDRGIAERCYGTGCPSTGNARPDDSHGSSGASGMPDNAASHANGAGSAKAVDTENGAVFRQW